MKKEIIDRKSTNKIQKEVNSKRTQKTLKKLEKVQAILMGKVLQETMKISTEIIVNITEDVVFAVVIDRLSNRNWLWVDRIADLQWTIFNQAKFRNVKTKYLIFQMKRESRVTSKTIRKVMQSKGGKAASQIVNKNRITCILIIIT